MKTTVKIEIELEVEVLEGHDFEFNGFADTDKEVFIALWRAATEECQGKYNYERFIKEYGDDF